MNPSNSKYTLQKIVASSPSLKNKKKSYIFLYFGNGNFLYFLNRKVFLYFMNGNPATIPYISGNKNPENFFIFQEGTFRAWKMKKSTLKMFLTFWEMKLFSHKIRNFLIFQERTYKAPKKKQWICSEEVFCLLWRFCNLYSTVFSVHVKSPGTE